MNYSFSDVLDILQDISDHKAAVLIECPLKGSGPVQRTVWLFDKTDKDKFSSKMDDLDWNALLRDEVDVHDI